MYSRFSYGRACLTGILLALVLSALPPTASRADVNGFPGPPLEPRVTVRAAVYLEVTWEPPTVNPEAVTDYELRYSTDDGSSWTVFADGVSTEAKMRVANLVRETSYLLQIRSRGVSRDSGWVTVEDSDVSVSSGSSHSCGVLASGQVRCWGSNGYGQLGDSTTSDRLAPVLVLGTTTAKQVTTGGSHSCARVATGQVMCWGSNRYGQLGDLSLIHI